MKRNWEKGIFNVIRKRGKRHCGRLGCDKEFEVIQSDPKIYCSRNCAAIVNNGNRQHPEIVKFKIANSLKGRPSPLRGIKKVPQVKLVCENIGCKKIFTAEQWAHRKFCSIACAMNVIGRKPTSPKAARGISGTRKDIDGNLYFYSRWEANFARILNLLDIKWIYQAKTFDLGNHTYTPDFYLPQHDVWIEIKNFLSDYSKKRDEKFRECYPDSNLILILKKDYLKLQEKFAIYIKNWEYN